MMSVSIEYIVEVKWMVCALCVFQESGLKRRLLVVHGLAVMRVAMIIESCACVVLIVMS
jgi:hypothetical protein